jgi:molybdopterin/thiamine biosynthesis adenylyltransferase
LSLSREELDRYSRQIALRDFGVEGQLKIKSAKVCVLGVGGLGSVSSLQLAGIGVGYLRIIDRDVVDLTNLQRQLIYNVSSIGYPKVEVAAKKLNDLNPGVKVDPIATSIGEENAESLVKGVDVVVDALDRFAPRFAINKACIKLKIPYVFGGAIEAYGNATTIIPGETPCLECLFHNADDSEIPTCERVGVIPPIINIIASIQVNETIRLILKEKPLLANKIMYCDLNSLSFDVFNVARRKECSVCGTASISAQRVEAKLGRTAEKGGSISELCGKESFMVAPNQEVTIDVGDAGKILAKKYKVKILASYGVTLNVSDRVSVSLMKGGNMLIKGVENAEKAQRIYDEIIKVLEGAN